MDLRLWANDPRKKLILARADQYEPGKFSFMVEGRFDYLSENLQDPDKTSGTKAFQAPAAEIGARFKYDYMRVQVEGIYRSLQFLLFDTPGFVPFQALPKSAVTRPEFYGILAVDYYIRQAYLTLGLTGGYKRPATYKAAEGVVGTAGVSSATKNLPIAVVKRRTSSSAYVSPFSRPIEILPAGKNAFDIFEIKFNTEFDLSEFMTFFLEMSYTLDNNRVKLATSKSNSSVLTKVFEDSKVTNRLGLALVVQAKF
jgi:hypothetical protein